MKKDMNQASLPLATKATVRPGPAPTVFSKLAPARPSRVFDTYWRFAAERQSIFFRRIELPRGVWTEDPILSKHKFTNAYRASDRVSQFLIRNVVYSFEQDVREVFFRTLIFKLFNRVSTWQLLTSKLGTPSWREYNFKYYDTVLSGALERGETIYSAAYIIPSAIGFDGDRKHQTHLRLLEQMMKDELPERLAESRSLRKAFELLRGYPMMGDFLAFQFITDLNYGPLLNFSEMDFVVPGPGARDGIKKCFESTGGLSEADIIRLMADRQEQEFSRLGLSFRDLWGRPLQLIDCQNLFCEVDKYARVAHPEISGLSGRTRIKQIFKPQTDFINYWYPPKWELNNKINATVSSFAQTPIPNNVGSEVNSEKQITLHVTFDAMSQTVRQGDNEPMIAQQNIKQAATIDDFQKFVTVTSRHDTEPGEMLSFSLLGLYGETGSLLSELKKKQREDDAYPAFAETVIEEFGDVLWYLADLASHAGISLSEVAVMAHRNIDSARPDPELQFGDMQDQSREFSGPRPSVDLQRHLLLLGTICGDLIRSVEEHQGTLKGAHGRQMLAKFLRTLVDAANAAEIDLESVAAKNQIKVLDRWPISRDQKPELFDVGFDEDEQLLRNFEIHFIEKTVGSKKYVIQSCQGIKIGDRLTDNMPEDDGYRFHDVFHLSYAAILGWSPVTRALMKCKRKSNPEIDEVEDGARAQIIEEGVSAWIFNHAKGRNFFNGLKSLDYGLLKAVRRLVAGFEVERCPLWQWERAILEGFNVFRQLRENTRGIVTVNLNKREIHYRLKA